LKAIEDKYPQVRIPKELYDDIKRHADRKGTSIGDTIQFAWNSLKDWKKAEMPNEEKMKKAYAEKLVEKVDEMKKQLEEQFSIRFKDKIKDLEDILRDAGIQNQELDKEKEQWKAKYEKDMGIMPMLKTRIDDLEGAFKIFQSSDIDSLRKEMELKNSEIKTLKEIIEGNKSKVTNAEQLIDNYQKMKEDLSEMRTENDNLRKASRNQSTELKWIKDTLTKQIGNILMMDSSMEIKPALARLKDEAIRKIDYELQKQADILM